MQENKDPDNSEENSEESESNEKTDGEENSLEEENLSTEDTDSAESDSTFEEQEGEVLPPEKKKGSGCGWFLLLLMLSGGGGAYLFYTDQIPPRAIQWVKPYYQMAESFLQEQGLLKSQPVSPSPNKWASEVEETREDFPSPQKKFPIVKKEPEPKPQEKPVVKTALPPAIEEKEHISGSPSEPAPETGKEEHLAKVSGNTTIAEPEKEPVVEEPEPETIPEEIEEEEDIEEPASPNMPAPQPKQHAVVPVEEPSHHEAPVQHEKPSKHEEPEEAERSEAVQAYLDFFEDTLSKIGELIKTGFVKAKDYLMKILG